MPRESRLGLGRESAIYGLRMPADLLAEWKQFTATHGDSAAEAIRSLMRHLMKRPQLLAGAGRGAVKTPTVRPANFKRTNVADRSKKKRVELQLTASEYAALSEIAEESECSVQYWVVNLVRASLTGGVAVGVSELKELGKSNYQLMAIGRNLNQIAHQINAEPGKYLPRLTADKIDALSVEIADHRQRVQAVVDACSERWVLEAKE